MELTKSQVRLIVMVDSQLAFLTHYVYGYFNAVLVPSLVFQFFWVLAAGWSDVTYSKDANPNPACSEVFQCFWVLAAGWSDVAYYV